MDSVFNASCRTIKCWFDCWAEIGVDSLSISEECKKAGAKLGKKRNYRLKSGDETVCMRTESIQLDLGLIEHKIVNSLCSV